MAEIQGTMVAFDGRVAVVVARFNGMVTESLLGGCIDGFERHGIVRDRVDVVRVPGSFELPLVAKRLAETGAYSVVVCLGCVIRGETGHYDHVAGQAAGGLMNASLTTGVPVVFGVLTTETVEQALDRAGLKSGNKGYEAACTAIELVNLHDRIGQIER